MACTWPFAANFANENAARTKPRPRCILQFNFDYSVSFLIDLKTSRPRRLPKSVVVLCRRTGWHSVLIVVLCCGLVAECCRDRPAGRHTVRAIVLRGRLVPESRALGASAIQAICIVIGRVDRIAILG